MYRIWTLILASVNEEDPEEDARLDNLADELIRASLLTDAEATKQLRAAVARTVRTSDPVFLLLQRRLLTALAERLAHTPASIDRKDAPAEMRTGRWERPYNTTGKKGPKLEVLEVKGFDDPVLTGAIQEVLVKIRRILMWIDGIWADLFLFESSSNGMGGTH